jgi:putative effector of murein hydrolase LrgA (UPF0299 family)
MKVVKVSNTLNRQEGSAVLIASVSLHIYLTLISVFGWVCDWVTLRAKKRGKCKSEAKMLPKVRK